MSRESFLARVRQAALSGRAYRVHVGELPEGTGYAGAADSDLCAAFAAEAVFVGGESTVVDGLQEARGKLAELMLAEKPASAYCWRHELLDRIDLAGLLGELGIERLDYDALAPLPEAQRRERILAAGCGITSCDCAVAETGSLMVCSRPGQERVASLLPPWHVALVAESQIVPDLFDAFARLGVGNEARSLDLPSNVTFITGPSKTGDIELELTTGVHGPGVWRTLVIRGA
jgi:L-lactate dehydrogenase complex protein LldG